MTPTSPSSTRSALRCWPTGLSRREIAEAVSASRSTVSRVVRRYEDQRPTAPDGDRKLARA